MQGVLCQPKPAVWSGVTVGGSEPFDGVWLRMTGAEPGTCRIAVEPAAIDGSTLREFGLYPFGAEYINAAHQSALPVLAHLDF
ncbi:hypothetical protein [Kibdelosporangium aridum]|uniref:hypothetical protein n=1 Tax=Kibdelosporangium aridum TaxID=2030 RepID=UPI000F7B1679|nr:hypothetical protein [Kibdelosporangium aridum]